MAFRNKIPLLFGETYQTMLTPLLPKERIDGALVHGDLRLGNIIMDNKGSLYLIDFELDNYLYGSLTTHTFTFLHCSKTLKRQRLIRGFACKAHL